MVIAVLAILALIALPSIRGRIVRQQITEVVHWADFVKAPVVASWATGRGLPSDNAAADMPSAERLVSDLVSAVNIEAGAIHIRFGNRADAALQGRILTLRPAVVQDAPVVPVTWLCGHVQAPPHMTAMGSDRTTVDNDLLPLNCR